MNTTTPTTTPTAPGPLHYLVADLETTGLDFTEDRVVEVAAIGLDAAGGEVLSFSSLVRLDAYGARRLATHPVALAMHERSGLLADLRQPGLPTLPEVEAALVETLTPHLRHPGAKVTLAGSGVSRFDQFVIAAQMPVLAALLHHTPLDVASLRNAYRFTNGTRLTDDVEAKTHRALDDARCHAEEIRAFLDVFAAHHATHHAA